MTLKTPDQVAADIVHEHGGNGPHAFRNIVTAIVTDRQQRVTQLKMPADLAQDAAQAVLDAHQINPDHTEETPLTTFAWDIGEKFDTLTGLNQLVEHAVTSDRVQHQQLAQAASAALFSTAKRPSVSDLIDAYAQWDGEVDTFVHVWDRYLAGLDQPCSEHPAGIHSTDLSEDSDGSCDYCGQKNRS